MKMQQLPEWLIDDYLIRGAEGEGEPTGASGDDPTGDDPSIDDEDPQDEPNEPKGTVHDDADDPKVKGLKSALATERQAKAAAEKELKKLRKAEEARELASKSAEDQATIRAEAAEAKNAKLAQGLLKRDIDAAIRSVAEKHNFIDVEDALAGVDRSLIVAEQDEDDPTDITIDLKTVTAQVKGLASKKPHFIKAGTTDGEPTGGQFGGSRRRKGDRDQELREMYPGL